MLPIDFRIETIRVAPTWHIHMNWYVRAFGVVHRVRNSVVIEFSFPIINLLQIRFVIEFHRSN